MKQVELIRQRIIRGQLREIVTLRQFISMTGDNNDVLERMEGKNADKLLADVTDFILGKLGHIVTPPKDGRTRTQKAL